jgi:hypothetical protein
MTKNNKIMPEIPFCRIEEQREYLHFLFPDFLNINADKNLVSGSENEERMKNVEVSVSTEYKILFSTIKFVYK